MDNLPHDLLLRISDLLSTSERARLTVLSKEWKQLVTNSWTDIRLEPSAKGDYYYSLSEWRIAWLNKLATQRPQTLRTLHIQLSETDGDLPIAQFHSFTQLRTLEISLSLGNSRNTKYKAHESPYPRIITSESLKQLSSLTCLENLRLLVNGLPFCVNVEGDGYLHAWFPLGTLASLPKLRHLNLDLEPCSGWKFNPARQALLSDFHELKSLRLDTLYCWDWVPDAVVSRLESLHLAVAQPIESVEFAPNLTHLWYTCKFADLKGGTSLPFKTSAKLHMLTTGVRNIPQPQDLSLMSCSIASLQLKGILKAEVVKDYSCLHSLTKLSVEHLWLQGGSVLQPFTCLGRLKSLCVENLLHPPPHMRLSEAGEIMADLTELELRTSPSRHRRYEWHLGDVAVTLPALREFHHASLALISGQISSSILEVVEVRCEHMPEIGLLGELPRLHKLTLTSETDFHKEKATLGHSLSALPNLRELSLVSLLAAPASQDIHADTIGTLLRALKAAKLKALKIAIPNSDLSLSLVDFPHLQALAVVCRAVEFDCPSLPAQNYSILNLHFVEASVLSIERFQDCKDVATTQLGGPDWSYFHIYGKRNQKSNKDYNFLRSGALHAACERHNGRHFQNFPGYFSQLVLEGNVPIY